MFSSIVIVYGCRHCDRVIEDIDNRPGVFKCCICNRLLTHFIIECPEGVLLIMNEELILDEVT